MSIPNILTFLRILLTFIFLNLFSHQGIVPKVTALGVFLLASLTDFLDGYLAKKNNWVTSAGKILDPIADKFLILAAFFVITEMRIMAVWMFVVVFIREVSVTALRMMAIRRGSILAAETLGKYKTCFQIITIIFILLFIVFGEVVTGAGSRFLQDLWTRTMWRWTVSIELLLYVTVGLTLISGISFFWKNREPRYV